MIVTTTCGWCGDDVTGVTLREHDDECDPHCQLCGEKWERKADAVGHDCPERDTSPPQDRVPETDRLEARERQRDDDGRAERSRLGLDR